MELRIGDQVTGGHIAGGIGAGVGQRSGDGADDGIRDRVDQSLVGRDDPCHAGVGLDGGIVARHQAVGDGCRSNVPGHRVDGDVDSRSVSALPSALALDTGIARPVALGSLQL